jgi:hypothetical protein
MPHNYLTKMEAIRGVQLEASRALNGAGIKYAIVGG